MAYSVSLLLDEKQVDFFNKEDLSFKIIKKYFDITQVDGKGGDYTLELKIPVTKNNLNIFIHTLFLFNRQNT